MRSSLPIVSSDGRQRWPALPLGRGYERRQSRCQRPTSRPEHSATAMRERSHMPASSTAPSRLPALPPYSRSHGGREAGSSDQPGWGTRSPQPAAGPVHRRPVTANPPLAALIDAARRKLIQQRAFRIGQLDQLDAARSDVATDEARSEIHLALEAAARSVLADIDAALLRIEQGRYGHCQRCGERMTVERLNALPMASLCGSCQRRLEISKVETAQRGRGT